MALSEHCWKTNQELVLLDKTSEVLDRPMYTKFANNPKSYFFQIIFSLVVYLTFFLNDFTDGLPAELHVRSQSDSQSYLSLKTRKSM